MMAPENLLRFGLIGLCLVLSAFFSSSETALFSLSPLRVQKYKSAPVKSLRAIARLLEAPRQLIVTLLIGNELVNVSVSILVAAVALSIFGPVGKFYAIAVSILLLLLFGEVVPKTYAVHRPESHARLVARPLMAFRWLITPVRVVLVGLVNRITPLAGSKAKARKARLTEEEFKTLVEVGHAEGVLDAEEKELIHSVVEFGDTRVSEVMTPRTDMTCIAEEATFEDVLALVRRSIFSRLPVYRGRLDNIVGVLYVKDLLKVTRRGDRDSWRLRDALSPVYFVPQTKLVSEVLQEFQAEKVHMAIVADENGGVAGLVTMEDILEELFGEIADELDTAVKLISLVGREQWRVSGKAPLDELSAVTEVSLPEDEFDTVGGFVLHLFGRPPKPSETIVYENLTFTVEKTAGLRILEVQVKRTP
ncbi:MAG: HlyC/CorC family transporter [Nitrospinae bacterium]|nr:HlyC/CorC family transporter [Nitrospinota bacterium]